jgi:AcrR family transcriptional regulator
MSPTPRRDGEATRQKLLRAALELYTTAGFRDTTTPAIAERAGVAEGTIYRHFSSKEDLLNAVYRAAQRWALGVITDAEGDHTARAPDRLYRIAHRMLQAAEHDAAGARMVLQFRDHRYLDDKSRDAAREVRDALQQVVAAGKSDGLVRAGPADLWVAVWLSVVAFAVERVCTKEWTPDHPHATQALEAAWNAIRQGEGEVKREM